MTCIAKAPGTGNKKTNVWMYGESLNIIPRLIVVKIEVVDGQQGDEIKGVTLTGHKGLAEIRKLFPLDVWSDKSGDSDTQVCEFKDYA